MEKQRWEESENMLKSQCEKHTTIFWKLRCRKNVRRFGANHILKSKCQKHTTMGPLLEVAMSKKFAPLWPETHFKVKTRKTLTPRWKHFWTFNGTTRDYNYNTTLHPTTSSSCGWDDHCNHSKKHNSKHLSVHQQIRSPTHASQKFTLPIVSYLRNFRHRLVRYYWYCSPAGDIFPVYMQTDIHT